MNPVENRKQNDQINLSYWRVFTKWWASGRGQATAMAISGVLMLLFSNAMTWNSAIEYQQAMSRTIVLQEVKENRKTTIENRCLGFAILVRLAPEDYPLPIWCNAVLMEMRMESP